MLDQFYHKKRILITGGSGFIGRHLQKALSDYGAIISVIDKNSAHNRFGDQQAIRNLTLLKEWCEE